MNPRIIKLKEERTKLADRIQGMQERLKAMDEQILKLENTDIVGIVRENGLTIDQLSQLMTLLETQHTSAIPEECRKMQEGEMKDEK